MDDELIEKMARAISVPEHHTTWELLSEWQKDLYREQATAALAAMREAMVPWMQEAEAMAVRLENPPFADRIHTVDMHTEAAALLRRMIEQMRGEGV